MYLENEKSFYNEIETIFHHFKGLSLKQIKQFFGRYESPTVMYHAKFIFQNNVCKTTSDIKVTIYTFQQLNPTTSIAINQIPKHVHLIGKKKMQTAANRFFLQEVSLYYGRSTKCQFIFWTLETTTERKSCQAESVKIHQNYHV